MLKSLAPGDLAEIIEFARRRSTLAPPTERLVTPKSHEERVWWQSTARIRARIAALAPEAERELLALAWLGRDRAPWLWNDLLARAETTPEVATHIAAKTKLHAYLVEGRRLVDQVPRTVKLAAVE